MAGREGDKAAKAPKSEAIGKQREEPAMHRTRWLVHITSALRSKAQVWGGSLASVQTTADILTHTTLKAAAQLR